MNYPTGGLYVTTLRPPRYVSCAEIRIISIFPSPSSTCPRNIFPGEDIIKGCNQRLLYRRELQRNPSSPSFLLRTDPMWTPSGHPEPPVPLLVPLDSGHRPKSKRPTLRVPTRPTRLWPSFTPSTHILFPFFPFLFSIFCSTILPLSSVSAPYRPILHNSFQTFWNLHATYLSTCFKNMCIPSSDLIWFYLDSEFHNFFNFDSCNQNLSTVVSKPWKSKYRNFSEPFIDRTPDIK